MNLYNDEKPSSAVWQALPGMAFLDLLAGIAVGENAVEIVIKKFGNFSELLFSEIVAF